MNSLCVAFMLKRINKHKLEPSGSASMCTSTYAEVVCFIMMIDPGNVFLQVSNVYGAVAVFQTAAVTCMFMWHRVVTQNILCILIGDLKLNDSKGAIHKKNISH